MIVALGICPKDILQARQQARWIADLCVSQPHELMLVADAAVQWGDAYDLMQVLHPVFKKVQCTYLPASVEGWPQGANALFFLAASVLAGSAFLWLEPDAIPIRKDFIGDIEDAYRQCGKPFMGQIYACRQPNLPQRLMSGIGVYPPDAYERLRHLQHCPRAWDVEMVHAALPNAHHTNLIQHVWGYKPGEPPMFVEKLLPVSPPHHFDLSRIKPETVLFHRSKDGTLIQLLRAAHGIPERKPVQSDRIVLVFSFCAHDFRLALRNMQWIRELNGTKAFDCVLSYQDNMSVQAIQPIHAHAVQAFSTVSQCAYPKPMFGGWPAAPNWAFQHTAEHMYKVGRPWFWLEADAIPTKPEWMVQIQSTYEMGAMPFMGPIVEGMGHMNGVGVYPSDFPAYCPKAMGIVHTAWDSYMKPEMISLCHNASRLIQHCWGIVSGAPHPRGGNPAVFTSQEDVDRWLMPSAVIFHRNKDGSLIDRLRERRNR